MSFGGFFPKFNPTAINQGQFTIAPPSNPIVPAASSIAPPAPSTSSSNSYSASSAHSQQNELLHSESEEEEEIDSKDEVEDEDFIPMPTNSDQCIISSYNLLALPSSKISKANSYVDSISLVQNSLSKPQRHGVQIAENDSLLIYSLRNGGLRVYHKSLMFETIFSEHEALVCDIVLFPRFDKQKDDNSFSVASLDVDDKLILWHIEITSEKSFKYEVLVKLEPEINSLFRRIYYFNSKNISSGSRIPAQIVVHHESSFSVLNLDNTLLRRIEAFKENQNDDEEEIQTIPISNICYSIQLKSREISEITTSANKTEFIVPCNDSSVLFIDRQKFSIVRKLTLGKTRTIEPILSAFEFSSQNNDSHLNNAALLVTTTKYNNELRLWKNSRCTHELTIVSSAKNRSSDFIAFAFEQKNIIILSDKNSCSTVLIKVNPETNHFELVSQIELKYPTYSLIPMIQSFNDESLQFGMLQLNQNGIDCHKIYLSNLLSDRTTTTWVKAENISSIGYTLTASNETSVSISDPLILVSEVNHDKLIDTSELIEEFKNFLSEREARENSDKDSENKVLLEKVMMELPEKIQASLVEKLVEKLNDGKISQFYLNYILDFMRDDIDRIVKEVLHQELKPLIASEIKKSINEISKNVVKDVSQNIRSSFQTAFKNNIIPAFRDGFQEMGQQITSSMKKAQFSELESAAGNTQSLPPRSANNTPNPKQKIQRPNSSASNASNSKKAKAAVQQKVELGSSEKVNEKLQQVLSKINLEELKDYLEAYDPVILFKEIEINQINLVYLAQQVCQMVQGFPTLAFKWLPITLKHINTSDTNTAQYFPQTYESMRSSLEQFIEISDQQKDDALLSLSLVENINQTLNSQGGY